MVFIVVVFVVVMLGYSTEPGGPLSLFQLLLLTLECTLLNLVDLCTSFVLLLFLL